MQAYNQPVKLVINVRSSEHEAQVEGRPLLQQLGTQVGAACGQEQGAQTEAAFAHEQGTQTEAAFGREQGTQVEAVSGQEQGARTEAACGQEQGMQAEPMDSREQGSQAGPIPSLGQGGEETSGLPLEPAAAATAEDEAAETADAGSPPRDNSPYRLVDVGYEQLAMGATTTTTTPAHSLGSGMRTAGEDGGRLRDVPPSGGPCTDCLELRNQLETSQVLSTSLPSCTLCWYAFAHRMMRRGWSLCGMFTRY